MKKLILITAFLFPLLLSAQKKPPVQISDKKDGSEITVFGKNNSKSDYQVELTLTSNGFGFEPETTFTYILLAKSEKEILRLEPEPGAKWSYSYKVKYSSHHTRPPSLPDAKSGDGKITVFSKYACNRSGITVNYLKNRKIDFKERDISKGKKNKELMKEKLAVSGFDGESLITPVVVVGNEVYYNIDNLYGFLEKLVKWE